MLDVFAGNRELLDSAARLYQEWRAAAAELEELERNEQEKLRLLDLWSFQRKEIESAALVPDEDSAARERTARAAERPEITGERGHGLRRGVRESGIGRGPGAHCRQARGRVVPHRCHARWLARAPEIRRIEPAGSRLRAARLFVRVGSQSRRGWKRWRTRLEAIDSPQAEVRSRRLPKSSRSWRKCAGRSRAWSRPVSAWRRCASSASALAAEFEKLAGALTEARAGGGAAARETRRGGTGAIGDGAHRVPRVDGGGALVRGGCGPGGVSGVAESGRRAAAAGKGGLGRRDFPSSRWR